MIKRITGYEARTVGYAVTSLVLLFIVSVSLLSPTKTQFLVSKVGSQVLAITPVGLHTTGGTGFNVRAASGQVYTVTNAHVCYLSTNGQLDAMNSEGRATRLRILEISRVSDLCILTAMPALSGLSLAVTAEVNDNVNVVGHPRLENTTLTSGYITNYQPIELIISTRMSEEECLAAFKSAKYHAAPPMIQFFFGIQGLCAVQFTAGRTTATAHPGNSGSPAVNDSGDVMGVLFAGSGSTNWGYIVPLNDLKDFLSRY